MTTDITKDFLKLIDLIGGLAFYEYDYSQEGKRKAQSLKDKRKNLEIKLGIQTKNESSRNLKKIYSGTNKRI